MHCEDKIEHLKMAGGLHLSLRIFPSCGTFDYISPPNEMRHNKNN